MAESENIDAVAAIRLAVMLYRSELDVDLVRSVLGDRHVKSLSQVAKAFGVKETTVRNTWRRGDAGMPGDAKRKCFVLADILIWYLTMKETAAAGRGENELTRRKQDAEARLAEANANLRERKDKRDEGAFAPVAQMRAEWSSFLSVLRDDVLSIPDDVKPMFPAKQADQLKDELERRLAKALSALAERPIDRFLERTEDDEELHD
jgi:phage terminase Nu1 subunit (DNA packaging protein)